MAAFRRRLRARVRGVANATLVDVLLLEQQAFDAAGIELVYKDYRGYAEYP